MVFFSSFPVQMRYPVPEYHQAVFACIMLSLVARTSYLLKNRLSEKEDREKVKKLYGRGAISFLVGFAIWNVDEQFCSVLQRGRAIVGPRWGVLLEGHAYWHLLTGLGCYWSVLSPSLLLYPQLIRRLPLSDFSTLRMVTSATLLVLTIKAPGERFEFVSSVGGLLPYVRRVQDTKKSQ